MRKILIFSLLILNNTFFGISQSASEYKNPIIYADYSDPDVCRVGSDFYMTASSFNCIPGLPILHSQDLVNWKIIGAAIERLSPEEVFAKPQHGNGVWAPSIRFHNGEFYIYYGDPDYGVYMTKTHNPSGEWENPVLVKKGKGLIDACPFWDNDGNVYLVHAFAGSRAGIKSVIAITRLTPDGKQAIGESKIVYDGHDDDETIEGPKLYKRNGFYYIFAPAGGVATGWQTVLRSENIYGPYERKVVMHQGNTTINGPHQGAWVDTPSGEDWFIHFQDAGAYGRIIHLQPMVWKNEWPVIGEDKDGDGCGEPVMKYHAPDNGRVASPSLEGRGHGGEVRGKQRSAVANDSTNSDEFSENRLGLQWQWHANTGEGWYFTDAAKGVLKLFSVPVSDDYKNLWDVPNLLLQKFPAQEFKVETKVAFFPNPRIKGEKAGLVVMGLDYAALTIESTDKGLILSQITCIDAENGKPETINESVNLSSSTVYLAVSVSKGAICTFSYSVDGKKYRTLGKPFTAKEGKWIGAKVGYFCTRPVKNNDGGRLEADWFRIKRE